jgi:hypothetical protein
LVITLSVTAGRARAQSCVGDCDNDGTVEINELVLGVGIALGASELSACSNLDNGHRMVSVDRLVAAVNNALCSCSPCTSFGTPTPTATGATPTPTATGATPTTTATGATPTTTAATPTATPTGGEMVTMWTVDDYDVVSSDCNGLFEDGVLRALQQVGSNFTVRESGMDVEIEDDNGNTYTGTVDPDGTVHVQRSTSDSIATCDYDVNLDASANLSDSPTTATYDADVNLSGFCLGFSDCSMRITARWRRVEG